MIDSSQNTKTAAISRRILVIEDNPDSAEVLQTFLEIHGHEITVCDNGINGLELAKRIVPDLIICDISLSGGFDGYGVAKEIRRHDRLKSIFLIALSGYGQPEDKELSRAAGFNAHLVKPADFDELLNLIRGFDCQ